MPPRIRPLALAAATILATLLLSAAGHAAATRTCPGTFQVLHDDQIGSLALPAGAYTITVRGVRCGDATQRFGEFLADWDGKLPKPWRTTAQGPGTGTFSAGVRSFSVRLRPGGGGNRPTNELICTRSLTVAQDDHIGALVIRKGRYFVQRLSTRSPGCGRAAVLLGRFLADFDGRLPGGWVLLADDATFVRGSATYGFRLQPDPSGGGGGRPVPTTGTRCSSSFRVVHDDRIGPLRFPAGPYLVSILRGTQLTCPQASQLFATFLARPDGKLPSPWVIDAATGSFRRGAGSAYGFVTKPAVNVR